MYKMAQLLAIIVFKAKWLDKTSLSNFQVWQQFSQFSHKKACMTEPMLTYPHPGNVELYGANDNEDQ